MENKTPISKEVTQKFESKNNLHFKELFDIAGDAIFIADIETGNIIDCNKVACKNLRYSKKEILNLTVGDLDATFISLEDEQKIWNSLKPNKPITIEGEHKRKDGTTFPVEIRISILKNNDKTKVLGIARDITDRKNANEIIKDRKQKLTKAEKLAKMGFLDWDLKTNKIDLSESVIKMYGLKLETNIIDPEIIVKMVHPNDLDFVQKNLNDAIAGKKPYNIDHRNVLADGNILWVQAQGELTYDEKGNKKSFLGTVIDITERKKIKEKIKESEEKYKALYDKAPLAYHSLNKDGFILDVNPAWLSLLGYKKSEVINRWAGNFLSETSLEKFKSLFPVFKKRGFISNEQFTMIKKDKTKIQVLYEGCIGLTPDGKFKQTYCTFKDVTEEVKVKEELIKAKEKAEESSRLKSEFLHNMSHEIRTPMNGILGFSDLLGNSDLSIEKQHHFVNIIQNSGKQLLRVIDDILEISRLGTKQVKVIKSKVCLNDLMVEIFAIFDVKAKEKKIPLYLKKPFTDSNSIIETDVSKLNKIISNLLENSFKYTNKGTIEFGYYQEKKNLIIYVQDTGIGILPNKLDLIFERFTQANEHPLNNSATGLGLGLSIAKENTELLGGKLAVTSKVMVGSKFTITLPFKAINKNDVSKKKDKDAKNKTQILIVEDEEVNYLYLETILSDFINCTLLHAKNGKEAVQFIEQNKNINFILMDLKMPVMNGYEATKRIKKINPNCTVIAQTAYSSKSDEAKAIKAGCTDFISKPLQKDKMEEILKKFLN